MDIRVVGDPFSNSGYSKCCREMILALSLKHNVSLLWLKQDLSADVDDFDFLKSLVGKPSCAQVSLQILLPPSWGRFAKYNIGCFFYEATKLSKHWVDKCNQMDAIIAPSDFVKSVCLNSGVSVPVFVVRFPYVSKQVKQLIPGEDVKFLSVFQWGWRKGWNILLRSYWAEFMGVKDISLTIKTYLHVGGEEEMETIHQDCKSLILKCGLVGEELPTTNIICSVVGDDDIKRFYEQCDVFVLPTRGEGLGRIFMDAVNCGKPIVATNWSAHTEFLGDDFYKVDYHMCPYINSPIDYDRPLYPIDSMYAEPHCDSLMSQMRLVYNDLLQGNQRIVPLSNINCFTNENALEQFGNVIERLVDNVQ
jgi:glycosyltransferase involved in cell wall biosynthesis